MPYPKKSVTSLAISIQRHQAAKWKRVKFRDNRTVAPEDGIGGDTCWCGEPNGHYWAGREEGAPHPIDGMFEDHTPPRVRLRQAQQALQDAGVCPKCRGYGTCFTCLDTGVFPPPSHAEAQRIRNGESR